MKRLSKEWLLAAGLVVMVYLVHSRSPIITSSDSMLSVPTAISIARQGDVELSEFKDNLRPYRFYNTVQLTPAGALHTRAFLIAGIPLEKIELHKLYNYFPYGPSLLAAPYAARIKVNGYEDWRIAERTVASAIAALTVGVFFIAACQFASIRDALLASVILAFASPLWSTGSRALWSHTPAALFIALGLLFTLKNRPALAGASFALAFCMRPTAMVPLAVFGAYHWLNGKRYYAAGAAVVLAAFVVLNRHFYGLWMPPYYAGGRLTYHPRFFEALAGNLVSPARGLLVFCPVLLFAFALAARMKGIWRACWITAALHWVAVSLFPNWFGGYSYGPRLFTELSPLLMLLAVPFIIRLQKQPALVKVSFAMAVLFGVYVHSAGALSQDAVDWNATPKSVFADQTRLWDYTDPPFARCYRLKSTSAEPR